MLFNSLHYLVFFPTVSVLCFLAPRRYRPTILLVASCYFYMSWNPKYILLMACSASVDFFAARAIEDTASQSRRRRLLALSLSTNLAILFTFKYYMFVANSIRPFLSGPLASYLVSFDVILPVGISFYTFQSMAYTIDVYRGRLKAERKLNTFALYVAFFPQLVAGPIERAPHLLPQIHGTFAFDYDRVVSGLRLILLGLFKKIVVADRLAIIVDQTYGHPSAYAGLGMWLGTYFFAFQIYTDFSAYSDIARGSARVLGVDLMKNFTQPYLATSVGDFWRRWHVSLSTWFRDYVYIPLGGSRTSTLLWCRNLAVVFVLSGLWHGAAWTFLAWGAAHASFLICSVLTMKTRSELVERLHLQRWPRVLQCARVLLTFHLVLLAWVLFRAETFSHALTVYRSLLDVSHVTLAGLNRPQLVFAVLGIIGVQGMDLLAESGAVMPVFERRPVWVRWGAYVSLAVAILAFGEFRSKQFLYFQF
ncbi:MAG: MBOAT family O-acyltransferase [Vicinamibacterales bacterium]